jgi:PTS system nitrogen regulatory IIA component
MKLSVREAAGLLSVSESAIYRWVEDGEIPCHIVNHQPMFSRAELLEWATVHRMPLSTELFDDGDESLSLASAIERGGAHDHIGGHDRESVIGAVVATLPIRDPGERELILSVMLAREREASTAIGGGVAIPHVRAPLVFAGSAPAVAVCYLERPVPFDAIDGEPVHVVFAMMTPTIRVHLQLLSRLSLALHDAAFKHALASHAPLGEILPHVRRIEQALGSQETRLESDAESE